MTAPDSPVPLVASQTTAEEVDLESHPGLPSLVQFSTRGLLLVTTATSVVVAILFGLYPTLFRCSRGDVAAATFLSAIVFTAIVISLYARRKSIETRAGKRYARIALGHHRASVAIPTLFGLATSIQLGNACNNFGDGEVVLAIMGTCTAAFVSAIVFLHLAWWPAFNSIELAEKGIIPGPLHFSPWSSASARSLKRDGYSLSVEFSLRKSKVLTLNAHQRGIVEAVLARHARATPNADRSIGNARPTDEAPSAPPA